MKKLIGILLLLVALPILLTTVPVQACGRCRCVTSLKVWKTICCVRYNPCTGMVTVTGYIHVQNDPSYTALIVGITDMVEAKYKDGPWTELETVNVNYWNIAPGETERFGFTITFEKGCYTAYRNVATVTLANHPTGERDFTYRLSFNIR